MEVKTFRARSMQEALQIVRQSLGPDAAVLQAREVGRGPVPWLTGAREIEVLASRGVPVPSRFAPPTDQADESTELADESTELADESAELADESAELADEQSPAVLPFARLDERSQLPPAHRLDYRAKFRADLSLDDEAEPSLVERLSRRPSPAAADTSAARLPSTLDRLLADLLAADLDEAVARHLIDKLRRDAGDDLPDDLSALKIRAAGLLKHEITCCGPIQLGTSPPRVVALIGPTGVGKTTTIAKLAAIYRLREHRRVGLITVDTYRIAAVEQLRTYAEIIDLPMEVVSTPREMRLALDRLAGFDLVLIDTAGRSPRDEIRLRELKSLLVEAQADEVHLVLSSGAGAASLMMATEQFRQVGLTALLLTKLDEGGGLGGLLPLLESSRLPLSYVTCGQNVPDDIEPADSGKLARLLVGLETH